MSSITSDVIPLRTECRLVPSLGKRRISCLIRTSRYFASSMATPPRGLSSEDPSFDSFPPLRERPPQEGLKTGESPPSRAINPDSPKPRPVSPLKYFSFDLRIARDIRVIETATVMKDLPTSSCIAPLTCGYDDGMKNLVPPSPPS